jgi:anti-anti-sigma factor
VKLQAQPMTSAPRVCGARTWVVHVVEPEKQDRSALSDLGPDNEAVSLLEITVEDADGGVVLRLSGEIDMSNAFELASSIQAHQESLRALDMREVAFVDCGSLKILLQATARARSRGSRLPILPSPALVRLVAVFGLSDALDMEMAG